MQVFGQFSYSYSMLLFLVGAGCPALSRLSYDREALRGIANHRSRGLVIGG